jgi:hypothetical protein
VVWDIGDEYVILNVGMLDELLKTLPPEVALLNRSTLPNFIDSYLYEYLCIYSNSPLQEG